MTWRYSKFTQVNLFAIRAAAAAISRNKTAQRSDRVQAQSLSSHIGSTGMISAKIYRQILSAKNSE